MLYDGKSQAVVENVESEDKVWYSKSTMNKNQSKRVGIVFVILVLIGLAYFGWYLFKSDANPNSKTNPNVATKTTTPTTTPTTTAPTKTDDNSTTAPTADLLSFSKDGFNFTFKYPKTWTIATSTSTPLDGNPDIAQKTVKIKTDTGIEFSFNNPAIATSSNGYDLKNAKDITAGTLTFNRNYGKNSSDKTLYTAAYNDPNNLDAASVSFEGFGSIDATTISNLDSIVSSFKFTQ